MMEAILAALPYTLPQYVLFFFLYAILGWCTEVAFAAVQTHELVNRGFLNGPLCPIYGCGMIVLLLLLEPFVKNLLVIFLGGMVLTTLIEWAGGALLFRLFHTRWWDYSQFKGNIGGYICPQFSLAWGAGSVVLMELVHPFIALCVRPIPTMALLIVNGVLLAGLAADIGVSVAAAIGLNKHLREVDDLRVALRVVSNKMTELIGTNAITFDVLMDESKLQLTLGAMEGRDNAAEMRDQLTALVARAAALRKEGENISSQRFFGTGRLLRAFPRMKNPLHAETLAMMRTHMASMAKDAMQKAATTAKAAAESAKAATTTATENAKATAQEWRERLGK